MTTDNFEAIKTEILKRAREHQACTEQYGRAYKSKNLAEMMQVIKDNFHWACRHDVVTPDIIEQYREDFAANDIYLNVDANRGFVLCVKATVNAFGTSTVEAFGKAMVTAYDYSTVMTYDYSTVVARNNSTVVACNSATVVAYGCATVKAYNNATVKAFDDSYCTSLNMIECKLNDNAIYRLKSKNIIFYANDEIKFVKQ